MIFHFPIFLIFPFCLIWAIDMNSTTDTAGTKSLPFSQFNTTGQQQSKSEICSEQDELETTLEIEILDQLMLTYNKQSLPGHKRARAYVEITINDITHLSELDSFFELDMFYSELWVDSRLAYDHWSKANCVKNITLDLDYLKKFWTPNICIVNSKSAVIHESPSENVFLILYQNGKVWKNCRMIVRGPCRIDLRSFPFDTQTCTLIFESYSFNSQRLTLDWLETGAITLSKSMHLADFHLVHYWVDKSIVTYPNGQWDRLSATFVFERRYGFFIWQAFIPSYMTIFVAWITFFMDPKELATRATLGISAFLAIMLQFGQIQQNQPRVSYMKAMDVWMLAAITFLFGALAELAVISYMIRSDRPRNSMKKKGRFGSALSMGGTNKFRRKYSSVNGYVGSGSQQGRSLLKRPMKKETSAGQVLPKELRCNCPWTVDSEQGGSAGEEQKDRNENCQHNAKCPKRVGSVTWRRMSSMITAYNVDKFFLIVYLPAFLVFNFIFWSYYL